jgi:hypothetical protein
MRWQCGPYNYIYPFCPTSTHHSGSSERPFFKPSLATGSSSRHLHFSSPGVAFHHEPPGCLFSTSWPGTHAHCHICQIQAHTFDTLQISFTFGIWLLCVQVPAHRSLTSSLQVYIQHWHVVYPTKLHLHFQSQPLILAFRILIPGSAVPKPPFASAVLQPDSILTHMSCHIHSTFLHF